MGRIIQRPIHMTPDQLTDAQGAARKKKGELTLLWTLEDLATLKRAIRGLSLNPNLPPSTRDYLRALITPEPGFKGHDVNLCNRCQKPKLNYNINCPDCAEHAPDEHGRHRQGHKQCVDCGKRIDSDAKRCITCHRDYRRKFPDPKRTNSNVGPAPTYWKLNKTLDDDK